MADNFNTSFLNSQELPLVIQAQDKNQGNWTTLIQYLAEENTLLKDKLLQYGAILFRGFKIDSPDKFLKAMYAVN